MADQSTGKSSGSSGQAPRASTKAERQAKAAAFQADLARQDRRRTLIMVGGAAAGLVVFSVALLIGVRSSQSSSSATSTPTPSGSSAGAQIVPSTPTGATTVQLPPASVTPPAGIDGLLAWDTAGYPPPGTPGPGTLAHDHVAGPVAYALTPPVGGPHSAVWMNAGVYTAAVPSERAVHDLEHGAVWITYDPQLPADKVAALTALVAKQTMIAETGSEAAQPGQANRYVVMSPWASSVLPSPIVICSWGYQLRVTSPDDPRLQTFIDTFRASKTYSPEFGSPVDGIPVETGGRAASNGGAVANPEGAATP